MYQPYKFKYVSHLEGKGVVVFLQNGSVSDSLLIKTNRIYMQYKEVSYTQCIKNKKYNTLEYINKPRTREFYF